MQSLAAPWLPALRAYFAVILLGNLAWEFLHLPLYTIWTTGTRAHQFFAAAHCTGGDLLIALASLALALLLAGERGRVPVAALAIILVSPTPPSANGTMFMCGARGPIRRGCQSCLWEPTRSASRPYSSGSSCRRARYGWRVAHYHRQMAPHQHDRGVSE
jgi:hypothetical protein